MTPEKLKLLAEDLGYEAVIENDVVKVEISYMPLSYDEKGGGLFIPFNPESNPTQREEVLLWLLGKGWKFILNGDEYEFLNYGRRDDWYSNDKDYTTALMMAAEKELGNE